MTHSVSPPQPLAAHRALPTLARGVFLSALSIALALAVLVAVAGRGRDALLQASVSERLHTVRAANELRVGKMQALAFGDAVGHAGVASSLREGSVRHGVKPDFVKPLGTLGETGLAEMDANHVAAAAAAVAVKAAAKVIKADAAKPPASEPGFVIATTDDAREESKRAVAHTSKLVLAHTSKLVMGAGAFETALGKKYTASRASPLATLASGTSVAEAQVVQAAKISTSKLDMADEGDKDVQVATTIKNTVGGKSEQGGNLTSGEPSYGTADDMKAVAQVQAAVKAAADAEVDEALATSHAAAKSSYTQTRDHFLAKEAKNNVTGTLAYSASDEIYHDSNTWVKELESLKRGGQDLSERPEHAFSVVVPAGVVPGQIFLAQVPGVGEMSVTMPPRVVAGQTIAIQVPVAVGPAKSLAKQRREIRSKEAAVVQQQQLQEKERIKTLASRLEAKFLADKQKIENNDEDESAEASEVKVADSTDGIALPLYSSAKAIEERFFADKKKLEQHGERAAKLGLDAVVLVKSEGASKEAHIIKQATAGLEKGLLQQGTAQFDKVERMTHQAVGRSAKRAGVAAARGVARPLTTKSAVSWMKSNPAFAKWPKSTKEKKKEAAEAAQQAAAAARAQQDDDHQVRTPRSRDIMDGDVMDGDEKLRGALHTHASEGYWGAAAVDGGYYGVSVPAGLAAGQQFLAQIPDGSVMLVTVPKGTKAGSQVAIRRPPGREQALVLGDAQVHTRGAAAVAKTSTDVTLVKGTRAPMKATLHVALGSGVTGLQAKWLAKEHELRAAVQKRSARAHSSAEPRFKEIEAARRKKVETKDWAKNAKWAAREAAAEQTHRHSAWMQSKTETLAFGDMVRREDAAAAQREGSVRHGVLPDLDKPMGNLAENGVALLRAQSAPSVRQTIAAEKMRAKALEQAHRHAAAASTLASPAPTTKPNTPLASTATMVAEPAVAAVEKTVLDKEADVFTSSESAVDKLEHEMLKKVARENAQRLAEEASTRKLEGLSPRAISPAHPALASASATSTRKRGAAAVVTKAHATKGLQIPRAALKTLQQLTLSEKELAKEALRAKWARKEWILQRILPSHASA